ncbi:hypothetical protein EDA74_04325 [Helicobacter pylori]|nr:hypothetical protein EDA74_04325 [Helicobacter pylori]
MLFKAEFKRKNYLNSSKTKLGILIKKICLSSFSVKIIQADGVSYPIVLALGRSAKNTQEKIRIFSSKPLPRFYDNRFSHLFADFISMH